MSGSPVRTEKRSGDTYLIFERTFGAPIADVWAALTEPERTRRWIGTWSGDPATGLIDFTMTAEGEEATAEPHRILVCDPPRRLVLEAVTGLGEHLPRTEGQAPADPWRLELELTEQDGRTTLTFAQVMNDPETASHVGPGWEYYLDRLAAVVRGAEAGDVLWDDYYPARREAFRAAVVAAG